MPHKRQGQLSLKRLPAQKLLKLYFKAERKLIDSFKPQQKGARGRLVPTVSADQKVDIEREIKRRIRKRDPDMLKLAEQNLRKKPKTRNARLNATITRAQEDVRKLYASARLIEVKPDIQTEADSQTRSPKVQSNIEMFKKQCGWSYEELAAKTGIDKKQILAHVHGTAKPRPRTLKEYAQAFAKELGQKITPLDLET